VSGVPVQSPGPLSELREKVALISGGSSGIGLGIARACAAAGMKVVVTYLTKAHLDEAAQYFDNSAGAFHAIRADVRDRSAMDEVAQEALERFGVVHLICANAGVGTMATVCDASEDEWDDAISTNMMGVINTIAQFLSKLLADRLVPAHIVATASMSGLFHGASAGVYTTTKFAVVGMMEALRSELQPKGIGVSVFCPGLVQSRIFDRQRNRRTRPVSAPQPNARIRDLMAAGMDPLECGQRVLSGVRKNAMYIISHPEYRYGVEERCQALIGAFDDVQEAAPHSRIEAERVVLRNRVYSDEIARQQRTT